MDFSKFGDMDGPSEIGFTVHNFLLHFNETFQQSGGALLDAYLKEFQHVTKWILVSDYAFYDKNKMHDVVTFSIIPYIAEFDTISTALGGMAPADLKKVRKVKAEFLNFLADGPVFNISIKLDRDRKLHPDERAYHKKKIAMLIGQLEYWCQSTPVGAKRYQKFIKVLRQLDQIVGGAGANLKAVRDIEIVATLAAYLMSEITTRAKVEIIGWFSDRDALLSYKAAKLGHFTFELVDLYYYIFCYHGDINSKGKLVLGLPGDDNVVWYDNLIRIPDLLAGTFADYDYNSNYSTHEKFIPVIEKLFVAEARNLFFKINFAGGLQAGRLSWTLAPVDNDAIVETALSDVKGCEK